MSPEKLYTNSSSRDPEVYEALRWIQLVMSVLSALGSGSIILCVTSLRLRPSPEPLFLLSVSDLLLSVCWLTGAALFSVPSALCYHLHTAEQVLYTASFFSTLSHVLDLYRGTREQLSCITGVPLQVPGRVSAALLSGLLPVLLMAPVFVQGNGSRCQTNFSEPYRCLLMYVTSRHQQPTAACRRLHVYRSAVFLASFLLTLLCITVLVVKARRVYRRVVTSSGYLGNQQQAAFRLMDRMLLYPPVFLLCWGPAVSLALMRLLAPSAGQGAACGALYISQAFTSASQGFLNSLLYGWTPGRLRRAGRTVLCGDRDAQTLLRTQRKTSYQTLLTG